MSDILAAAVFLALFYLLVNPSNVRVRMNLMVAWFIFIGALAVTLLAAISEPVRRWIDAIQATALAVSLFFMLIAVEPGAQPTFNTATSYPPPTPPTTPPAQ